MDKEKFKMMIVEYRKFKAKKRSRMKDSRDGLLRKNLNTRKSPEPKSLVGS